MLAALFGALWLFTAVPAQAQSTTLLSGTLTVKNLGGNSGYGCWNGSATVEVRCSTTATLSDDDFTYGGTDYAITAILSIAGQIRIQLDKAVPQGLRAATLNIGSFALALSNATFLSSDTVLTWSGSYPQLTLDSTVSVSLVPPPPTVSLSASPNPVTEGSLVTVTATLSRALSNPVTIPVTITDNTAEPGDHGTLTSITIAANAISGTGTISTSHDLDDNDEHETFTVALDTANLPSSVTVGSPASVQITINDDEGIILTVDATPACGTTVTDLSVELEPLIRLSLDPASMKEAQYVGIDNMEVGLPDDSWHDAGMFNGNGRLSIYVNSVVKYYRENYRGFAGFAFRLADNHSVTARCPWRFDSGNTSGTPRDTSPPTPRDPAPSSPDPPTVSAPPPPTGSGPPPGGGGGGDEPPPEDEEPSDPDQPDTCGENDRENLERFYETTGGAEWDENENWNSDEAPQEWFGVETDEDGNVVSLRLSHNALSGDMPARELLCLSELKELALWGNDNLPGEVPEKLVLAVERAVLRDIAEMLDLNPEWFENYGDPYNFEDWHEGVTTDDDGRVVELDLTGEVPGTLISQLRKLRVITTSSENGGCALSLKEDSSAFSLFLLALLVFAALGRTRARG